MPGIGSVVAFAARAYRKDAAFSLYIGGSTGLSPVNLSFESRFSPRTARQLKHDHALELKMKVCKKKVPLKTV